MADVDMKDASKPAGEEEKKEETKIEEPTDMYYGKSIEPAIKSLIKLTSCFLCVLLIYRTEEVPGYPGEGWKGEGF